MTWHKNDGSDDDDLYDVWHARWQLPLDRQGARAHQQHMDELLERIRRLRGSQAAMETMIHRLKLEWLQTFRAQRRYLKQAGLPSILHVLEDAAAGAVAHHDSIDDVDLMERATYGATVAEGEP